MGFRCAMMTRSSCCLFSSVHLTIFAMDDEMDSEKLVGPDVVVYDL